MSRRPSNAQYDRAMQRYFKRGCLRCKQYVEDRNTVIIRRRTDRKLQAVCEFCSRANDDAVADSAWEPAAMADDPLWAQRTDREWFEARPGEQYRLRRPQDGELREMMYQQRSRHLAMAGREPDENDLIWLTTCTAADIWLRREPDWQQIRIAVLQVQPGQRVRVPYMNECGVDPEAIEPEADRQEYFNRIAADVFAQVAVDAGDIRTSFATTSPEVRDRMTTAAMLGAYSGRSYMAHATGQSDHTTDDLALAMHEGSTAPRH